MKEATMQTISIQGVIYKMDRDGFVTLKTTGMPVDGIMAIRVRSLILKRRLRCMRAGLTTIRRK